MSYQPTDRERESHKSDSKPRDPYSEAAITAMLTGLKLIEEALPDYEEREPRQSGKTIDEYADDPRRGQANSINRSGR
jgi:hypothetical protein